MESKEQWFRYREPLVKLPVNYNFTNGSLVIKFFQAKQRDLDRLMNVQNMYVSRCEKLLVQMIKEKEN